MRTIVRNLLHAFPSFTSMSPGEAVGVVMPKLAAEFPPLPDPADQVVDGKVAPAHRTALLEVQLHPLVPGACYIRVADEAGEELLGAPWLILADGATRLSAAPREELAALTAPRVLRAGPGAVPPAARGNGRG